jgi:hypothetical protein
MLVVLVAFGSGRGRGRLAVVVCGKDTDDVVRSLFLYLCVGTP